jgi:hypothetical protein
MGEHPGGVPVARWRWLIGAAIVVGIAVVLVLTPPAGPSPTTTTQTTTAVAASPPTTAETTSSTSAEQRLTEVERILRDLWFGWFDAIYRKDADALWEVVATRKLHDDGVRAMESMEFVSPPTRQGIQVEVLQLLLDRSDCLVVHEAVDVTPFRGDVGRFETVGVLWPRTDGTLRVASAWRYPGDRWIDDCDAVVREPVP